MVLAYDRDSEHGFFFFLTVRENRKLTKGEDMLEERWEGASSPVVTQAVVVHVGSEWHLPSAILTLGLVEYLEAIVG